MQKTSAYSPTVWPAGGAMSRARPARKPVSTPGSGPPVRASATTTSSTRSGPAPPGRDSRLTMVSWAARATATRITDRIRRRNSAPGTSVAGGASVAAGAGAGVVAGAGVAGGGGDGHRDGRGGLGAGRQHRVVRVLGRAAHHHADDPQGGEVHERLDQCGLGQRTGVALD